MLLNLLSQLRKSARVGGPVRSFSKQRRLPKDLHSQVKKEYAGAVRDAREMGITSFMHRIGLCKVREILRSKDELKYGKDENGYDFVSIFYEGILLKSINRGGSSILSQADGVEKPIGEVPRDFTLQREDTFKELSFAKMFSRLFTKQPLQILIVGLPGSGKTTILSKLLGESVTTIGETVQLKNIIFTTWCEDKTSGGNTRGVIYVVDSGDHGALVVARENLHKLLNELKNVHLLVFANKQDLPNAMDAVEITHKLGLHSLPQQNWYILGTCANSEEGFYEGADWLSNNIANKEPQVPDSWFTENRPVLKSLFEGAYGKGGKRALPITPGDPLTKGLERIKEFYHMEGIIETGVDQNGDGFAQLSFSKWVLRNLIRKGKARSHFTVSVGRSTYDICSAN